jgi:sugar-specific transcriptional regulator TrmB
MRIHMNKTDIMVASQHVLDALRQIGLNLYERKLWVALLSRGTATAGELSSLSKVPHSRTYDVLESLAEKGFVMAQASKPLKYMAIAPTESLERAKKKIKEDFEITVDRITKLQSSSIVKELDKIFKNGVQLVEPGEMTGALKGRKALHNQLESLFKTAKQSISILTTIEGLNDLHANHADLLKKIAGKGVKVRIAIPDSKDAVQAAAKFKGLAEVRKVNKAIEGRFAIIDNSHFVIALTDEQIHPTQDFSLWTQSEHVAANVISPLFDMLWKSAETV